MPQKNASSRKNTNAASRRKQPSGLQRILSHRFAMPILFFLAFMLIGGLSLLAVSAATTSYSLWGSGAIPKTLAVEDSKDVEVGLKFRASVAGYVTGIRFYKSAQNTGTHTGNLWNSNGQLLASVQFSNETASGWQTATFSRPVSIGANATYVVSYHAPQGRYSLNPNYFTSNSRTTSV
jgi:carbohydrate-selective porin OprB